MRDRLEGIKPRVDEDGRIGSPVAGRTLSCASTMTSLDVNDLEGWPNNGGMTAFSALRA